MYRVRGSLHTVLYDHPYCSSLRVFTIVLSNTSTPQAAAGASRTLCKLCWFSSMENSMDKSCSNLAWAGGGLRLARRLQEGEGAGNLIR